MSLAYTPDRLTLPATLEAQLHGFRRRVWLVKIVEAVAAAIFGVLAAYLVLFCVDRVWDTPGWPRLGLFVIAAAATARIPWAGYRWVWRHRRLDQLARLLARKHPRVGDQLLGVIELVRNDFEQARSRALCEAAIREVARDAERRDFRDAVPNPRHRQWILLGAMPTVAAFALLAVFPAAAANAWQRFLLPWKNAPRYTFTMLDRVPEKLVVAHGEPFAVILPLSEKTAWRPKEGVARLGEQTPVVAGLRDGRYNFELPPQIAPGSLDIRIGDAIHRVRIEPTLRPELVAVVASVALPGYLGRPELEQKDVRGGNVSLVIGSTATFTATASRDIASAWVDGQSLEPAGAAIKSLRMKIDGSRKVEFRWQDPFGLAGKEPFVLTVNGRDDEAPTLACEDLPRQKVVLDTELLSFKVRAQDDFGIKEIGLDWQGIDSPLVSSPAKGERILSAGGNRADTLESSGTFSARSLGIEPQPVQVRLFATDYFPDRPRVYSPTYTFYVLNAEQHAIWVTEQLSKWHRQSLEVRDKEMQLFETNKQLRSLAGEELDRPETRRKIENQASAERANGRRLLALTNSGEDLLKQAMRNPEFKIANLEKWAEMLQILKDIAGNRMPSVADLLAQGAQAPSMAMSSPSKNTTKMAGQNRASQAGSPSQPADETKKPPSAVPLVVDRESSQQPADDKAGASPASKSAPKTPRLTFPVTSLDGKASATQPKEAPAVEQVDEAVVQQQDLLAEFEKIADELNRVLANLEGSTLVKRLKAASRVQSKVGGRITDQVSAAFGVAGYRFGDEPAKVLGEMSTEEGKASHEVSLIMDDMHSYFERRRFMRFKAVLDDMRQQDIVGSLRTLGDDLKKENGVSIAQCEFWSDTLDRWAEDLVDPASSGTCNAKSKSSLPPALVLEALQILEKEVNLREETRVAQQARPALKADDFKQQGQKLSESQKGLNDRVDQLGTKIRELPDGESEFAYEIGLLAKVSSVMGEATSILAQPETGNPAIAAETEAIELLLQSKRINPKGGGGGGASPGGGGKGKTIDSALALFGGGVNEKEVREDRGIAQATGDAGPGLPEEFRAGLDEYFNRLERGPNTPPAANK
jgi:hypothetical protein